MIRIDGNIPHTSPESFQIHIPCLPHRFTHQTVELWHRALVSWVTNVPDLHTTLPSCVNVSGGVTDGNGTHHLSMVQCVDLTGMAGNPWAHQSVRGERHWLHLSVSRHVKRVSTDDTKEDRRRRLNMIANVTEDEDKDKYWYKSLSIIFRGFFFFFSPMSKQFCHRASQSAFKYISGNRHLRFAARDSCQTGRHSRNSHVRMRIKTDLKETTKTLYQHIADRHRQKAHRSIVTCGTEHKHSWAQGKQTLLSTHTLHIWMSSLRVGKQTETEQSGLVLPPIQHTQLVSTQPEFLSSITHTHTYTAVSLLNLFKQCNEHYANTAQSDEAIERNAHQRSPLYKYYHTDKRNTAVQLLALSTLCNIKSTVLWKVFTALNFMNF